MQRKIIGKPSYNVGQASPVYYARAEWDGSVLVPVRRMLENGRKHIIENDWETYTPGRLSKLSGVSCPEIEALLASSKYAITRLREIVCAAVRNQLEERTP